MPQVVAIEKADKDKTRKRTESFKGFVLFFCVSIDVWWHVCPSQILLADAMNDEATDAR